MPRHKICRCSLFTLPHPSANQDRLEAAPHVVRPQNVGDGVVSNADDARRRYIVPRLQLEIFEGELVCRWEWFSVQGVDQRPARGSGVKRIQGGAKSTKRQPGRAVNVLVVEVWIATVHRDGLGTIAPDLSVAAQDVNKHLDGLTPVRGHFEKNDRGVRRL